MNLDVLSNPHSDEIAAFLAVAAQGSFVAAGRLLQRHPTIVSKRLAAMEKRLGVRLIHRRILCASPAYIEAHGMPQTPQDLLQHNCLRFSGLASFPLWRLHRGDELQTITPRGNLTASDSESLLAAARADAGILGAGDWLMSRDLAAGRLIQVLPDWQLDSAGGVYLVRPSSRFPAAAVVAFKEWIEAQFDPAPPWAV